MNDVRQTEVDGFQVTWRLLHPHRIAIMAVHDTSDNHPVAAFDAADCPDLVQVREQLPKLDSLWNAVRHEFWVEMSSPSVTTAPAANPVPGEENSVKPQRHARELPSIRPWILAIEDKAGPGYRIARELDPPYGWNLFDPKGIRVCSGSLDRLELWAIHRGIGPAKSVPG
ncbi:hypothetical protein IU500_06500 [Nocardia terpenica]|nr:hypothetical protein [Nocardia terpenica]MBF6060429.1 hypothetical protein [Nocardia terpenica]MBF6103689.1 hypothetical protein [Nocardia terpenica]MBF6111937.1 hypothetical protein [Nocardia terpenica]MBF6117910.1 hypothetical protein [Nocardia terpenica]MBF6155364.1 hypothetical protein [Nocardia terpenica]